VLKPAKHLVVLVPLDAETDALLGEDELINPEYIRNDHFHVRNYNMASIVSRCEKLEGATVVFQETDGYIWDWRQRIEPARQRLQRSGFLGRLINTGVAGALNVPFSVMPRAALRFIDQRLSARGYRPRQAVLVVRKS
jgi:hypothetical protein